MFSLHNCFTGKGIAVETKKAGVVKTIHSQNQKIANLGKTRGWTDFAVTPPRNFHKLA